MPTCTNFGMSYAGAEIIETIEIPRSPEVSADLDAEISNSKAG